jgi:hypothetical protein
MENHTDFCTIIDSNGERKIEWDVNKQITPEDIRALFPPANGRGMKVDRKKPVFILGPTTLVRGKTYIVPVPPKGLIIEFNEIFIVQNLHMYKKTTCLSLSCPNSSLSIHS